MCIEAVAPTDMLELRSWAVVGRGTRSVSIIIITIYYECNNNNTNKHII